MSSTLEYLNPFSAEADAQAEAAAQGLTPEQMAQLGVTPEQLSQMSPEQISQLQGQLQAGGGETAGGSSLQADYYHESIVPPSDEVNRYQARGEQTPEVEAAAQETFRETFERGIAEARKGGEEDLLAAERAMQNADVADARQKLDSIFADKSDVERQQVERDTVADVLKEEGIAIHSADKVAEKAAQTGSFIEEAPKATVSAGERVVVDGKSVKVNETTEDEQILQSKSIDARNNGMTKRFIRQMRTSILGRMKNLGIKTKIPGFSRNQDAWTRMKVGSEAAYVGKANNAKSQDVTRPARTEWVENKVVGEELVSALSNPRKQTVELRQRMSELAKTDPSAVRELGVAVKNFKGRGTIDRRTAEKMGRLSRRIVR